MNINAYVEYRAGVSYTVFKLSEFNSKVTKFLKKIGFTKDKDLFTYSVETYKTIKQEKYGDVRIIDVAYYQLKKVIVASKNCYFTNYVEARNKFYIKDGFVTLQYNSEATQQLVIKFTLVDASSLRGMLFDLGFSYSSATKEYTAPMTYMLYSFLKNSGFLSCLGVDEHEMSKQAAAYIIVNEKRSKLMEGYQAALRTFMKHYNGTFSLLPHQAELVLNTAHWGIINAFDMGCGKTFTSLYQAAVYRSIMPLEVIVVCPKSVMSNWEQTAGEHFGMAVHVFSWSDIPEPSSSDYVVIFDECHYMQEASNSRSTNALVLASQAVSVLCLSGTASRNGRAKELFNVMKCIGRKEALVQSEYARKFGWDNDTKMTELAAALKGVYFYVNKKQVLDLAGKQRVKHSVKLSDDFTKLYDEKFSTFMESYYGRVMTGEVSGNSRIQELVSLQGLRLSLAIGKSEATAELALKLVKQRERVVIFSDFNEPLDLIGDMLDDAGVNFVRVTADDSAKERLAKQNAFKAWEYSVFLCSFKVGGVGIDLTPCKHMIFNDRPYTPGDALQAEDRCNRIGQLEKLTVHWVWWDDPSSIEGKIAYILSNKQNKVNDLNQYVVSLEFDDACDL